MLSHCNWRPLYPINKDARNRRGPPRDVIQATEDRHAHGPEMGDPARPMASDDINRCPRVYYFIKLLFLLNISKLTSDDSVIVKDGQT